MFFRIFGFSIGPVMLAVLLAAMQKGYSPGKNGLTHLTNDEGKRAAMTITYQSIGSA